MPLAPPGTYDNTLSFVGDGQHAFEAHSHCPVVRLPDWPHECPAMYDPRYANHVLMRCARHDSWWHLDPPSPAFDYWMPPMDGDAPDDDKLRNYYLAIRHANVQELNVLPMGDAEALAADRFNFLRDVIITAIEIEVPTGFTIRHYHPGAEYPNKPGKGDPTDPPYAEVYETGDEISPSTSLPVLNLNTENLEEAFRKLRNSLTSPDTSTYGLNWSILSSILLGDTRNDASNIDKEGAEVLMQIALLNEVRYS